MLQDSRNRPVRLGDRLGGGGEGEVFEVVGTRDVAKVLHAKERIPERLAKLRVMISHVPQDPTRDLGHPTMVWPKELLFEGRQFAGFLMPRVDIQACPTLNRFMFPRFYPGVFSWRHQLDIAANLAGGLAAIHAAGYVVGDLNGKNLHVTPSCLVTFVDCDSIQVRDPATGIVFRCPVGTPEYTAPELQNVDFRKIDRTEASDAFALAVMVCQLLLGGTHPFAGGSGQTREENITKGDSFLLGGKIPMGSPPAEVIPPELRDLLARCLQRRPEGRPKASGLARALGEARGRVAVCAKRPDQHAYGDHLSSCPWCEYAQRVGADLYGGGARLVPPKKPSSPPPARPVQTAVHAPAPVARPVRLRTRLRTKRREVAVGIVLVLLLILYMATRVPPRRYPLPPGGMPAAEEPSVEIRWSREGVRGTSGAPRSP